MDDGANREYSRPPEIDDVVALCRALNEAGALYVLIGGFATVLHGLVRTTKDVGLLVDSSPENVRRLKTALATLPDNAAAQLSDDEVIRYGVVRVADAFVVDLMGSACAISYEEALSIGVERKVVKGVEIPVASKELLIRTKQTLRESDRADVGFLQRLVDAERAKGD